MLHLKVEKAYKLFWAFEADFCKIFSHLDGFQLSVAFFLPYFIAIFFFIFFYIFLFAFAFA